VPQDVAPGRHAPSSPRHHRRRRRFCAARAEIWAQLGSSVAFGSGCGQTLPVVPRKAPLCSLRPVNTHINRHPRAERAFRARPAIPRAREPLRRRARLFRRQALLPSVWVRCHSQYMGDVRESRPKAKNQMPAMPIDRSGRSREKPRTAQPLDRPVETGPYLH